jgi:hypothetical protein
MNSKLNNLCLKLIVATSLQNAVATTTTSLALTDSNQQNLRRSNLCILGLVLKDATIVVQNRVAAASSPAPVASPALVINPGC